MNTPITVFLVDDHEIFRNGLKQLVDSEPDMEIIGEAVKQLPNDLKQRYSHLDWRAMAGMRDRLIHGYFGVDYDIMWDVVINKIPALQREVEHLLRHEGTD